jgi:hypothetical protein
MSTHLRFSSSKFPNAKLGVLRFGLLQYRDVGVGGFTKGVFLIRAFCYFDSCSSRTSES